MNNKYNITGCRTICRNQQGFSLIELAVVLLVIGVILGGAAGMIAPYIESTKYRETQKKLQRIEQSLALFAQSYYTLPCPAESNPSSESLGMPFNTASPYDFVSQPFYTSIGNDVAGIVPFRVLGLTEEDAKDAYGNYITYLVSAVFNQYRASLGDRSVTNFEVHKNCLTEAWKTGDKIWNMDKAKFCCPKWTNWNLLGNDNRTYGSGTNLLPNNYNGCPANFRTWSAGPITSSACAGVQNDIPETIAYALISHGKNGYGAFLRDGSKRPKIGITGTPQEAGNVTSPLGTGSTNTFVERPISFDYTSNGVNYFDDIVLWRTNHQIISTFGNDSCDYP